MPVEPGYWRSDSESHQVLECFLGVVACAGSSDDGASTHYCHTGYEGPMCDTCARGYFMDWANGTARTAIRLTHQA